MTQQQEIIRIGNAQAFWGDSPSAPARLVEQQPNLDYLTLDYLAEVSMSIMAIQREKDPSAGYARDFLDVVKSLAPFWLKGSRVKVVTNAGGLNPLACAEACKKIVEELGCPHIKIGVITGDDVLPFFKNLSDSTFGGNLDSGESISKIKPHLMTANAYLGAKSISSAILAGADIVITGRVADPSLTVGPCAAHFGWSWEDYDSLAGATVAGHLIECGTQVTGGIFTNWLDIKDPFNIGFPVAEISADGSCTITKPLNTGGLVNIPVVKEQLLYEIGDPNAYLSPDVTVSFLALKLSEIGKDRVHITGAKGLPPPPSYKVSATYRDGFRTEGMLTIFGQHAEKKARLCGEIILKRLCQLGFDIQNSSIECLGINGVAPGIIHPKHDSLECILRISLSDSRYEALECFTKELASLVTSGPQGVTGYISGRPHIRPVFGYWPTLIEVNHVFPKFQMLN